MSPVSDLQPSVSKSATTNKDISNQNKVIQNKNSQQKVKKKKKKRKSLNRNLNNNNNSGHQDRRVPNWKRKNCNNKSSTQREEINKWSPTPSDDSDQEICLYYLNGACNKTEEECPYSHDTKVPKFMNVCKHYLTDSCLNSETCPFLHQEFPCKYFHSTGACRFGSNCKFSHEKNELTVYLLEKFFENEAARLGTSTVIQQKSGNSPGSSSQSLQAKHSCETTSNDPSLSQLEKEVEEEIQKEKISSASSAPVFSSFYQDITEVQSDDANNECTPMPLEISSILSTMENTNNEPPSSPLPEGNGGDHEPALFSQRQNPNEIITESFDDGHQPPNSLYPAKVITITLPSIHDQQLTNGTTNNNAEEPSLSSSTTSNNNPNINWRVCKVGSVKKIDYNHVKESSSMGEILMDPRLNKCRSN